MFEVGPTFWSEEKHCWVLPMGVDRSPMGCYDSDYEIRDNSQLWSHDRRIGDIYPGRISLLDSGAQVSEQIVLELTDGTDQPSLKLFYTYANSGGASERQRAVLTRK